jgi:hypothetical protein
MPRRFQEYEIWISTQHRYQLASLCPNRLRKWRRAAGNRLCGCSGEVKTRTPIFHPAPIHFTCRDICEPSRLPHFLDYWLTDGGEVVSLHAGRPLLLGRFLVLISVRGWVDPRAIVRLEGLSQLNRSNALIGNRTRYLPACSIVSQSTTLPRALIHNLYVCKYMRRLCSYYFHAFLRAS